MTAAAFAPEFLHSQNQWTGGRLNRLRGLREWAADDHSRQWARAGHRAANSRLRGVTDRLRDRGLGFHHGIVFDFGLSFDAGDDEIRDYCEGKSRQCERLLSRSPFPALEIAGILERCRIGSGWMLERRGRRPVHWEARVTCPMWWRRKMRVICARESEQVSREHGLTHRRAGCYVSEFTFRRWLSQQNRNRLLLEEMEAINGDGEAYTLADLSALSTSNPELRRGELMARLRGFEEWADQDSGDWCAVFYTLTCPSKFHAYSGARENPKYAGADPREAQAYLSKLWAGFRAWVSRRGLSMFGFRIAEPHHDGCPHWHLLLFVDRESEPEITGEFRARALAEDGTEPGAAKHRFTAEIIDRERGSAAGYVSKYISKNVDGYGVDGDYEAGDFAESTALRVRAWASTWGIRQFQQIGGPPVTVWRELRRAANNDDRLPESEQLALLLEPADAGNWSEFTERMGGAVCARADRPARVEYSELDRETLEPVRGRYGDRVRRILGVIGADFLAVSRWRTWIVQRKNKITGAVVAGFRDLAAEVAATIAGACPPWTCVNNCTGESPGREKKWPMETSVL